MSATAIERATAAACWLLGAATAGVPLTQTYALARAVVREAVERWPEWWDTEAVGPPWREADVRMLDELHGGLKRLGLVRRRGRKLLTTKRGSELARNPAALLEQLAADLGGGKEFGEVVASAVVDALLASDTCRHAELRRAAAEAASWDGWTDEFGQPPRADAMSWDVSEILARGEAYGLIERRPDPSGHRWSTVFALTEAGRPLLASGTAEPTTGEVLVFDAELVSAEGVSARLAVGAEQHLTALHDAIQRAFGWFDDHLYSFWLDGQFWGDKSQEFTTPDVPDEAPATADVPMAELGLRPGARIAYIFDFGDEWRVLLTLRERVPADGGPYPRVLERVGEAPPQY